MFVIYNEYGEIIKLSNISVPNSIAINEEVEKDFFKNINKYRVLKGRLVFADSLEYKLWYYEKRLDNYIDSVAQQKGYDNRITCTMRAGVEGSPYQAECKKFAVWQDLCYEKAYQIMNDVLSGKRPAPTIEQLIEELPKFSWE